MKEQDPGISKVEIYEKLLEPFRYEKNVEIDEKMGKFHTIYF